MTIGFKITYVWGYFWGTECLNYFHRFFRSQSSRWRHHTKKKKHFLRWMNFFCYLLYRYLSEMSNLSVDRGISDVEALLHQYFTKYNPYPMFLGWYVGHSYCWRKSIAKSMAKVQDPLYSLLPPVQTFTARTYQGIGSIVFSL